MNKASPYLKLRPIVRTFFCRIGHKNFLEEGSCGSPGCEYPVDRSQMRKRGTRTI